jgi:hypothetical protein
VRFTLRSISIGSLPNQRTTPTRRSDPQKGRVAQAVAGVGEYKDATTCPVVPRMRRRVRWCKGCDGVARTSSSSPSESTPFQHAALTQRGQSAHTARGGCAHSVDTARTQRECSVHAASTQRECNVKAAWIHCACSVHAMCMQCTSYMHAWMQCGPSACVASRQRANSENAARVQRACGVNAE